jgi:hypothetical protein
MGETIRGSVAMCAYCCSKTIRLSPKVCREPPGPIVPPALAEPASICKLEP